MASHSRPEHSIKVAETKDETEACLTIRFEVFSVEQGFPEETEIDEYDPISIHLLLTTPVSSPPDTSLQSLLPEALSRSHPTTSSKPIGVVRFVPKYGKVGRLAVDKEYRQYGFGKVLMSGLDDYVRGLDAEKRKELGTMTEGDGKRTVRLKLHSQMQVIRFYEKLGYTAEGPEFDEEGAPHRLMVKDIVLSE